MPAVLNPCSGWKQLQNSDNNNLLEQYGWNGGLESAFIPYGEQGLSAGRIIRDGRELYRAVSADGEVMLSPSGSFRYLADLGAQPLPVVGDWCAFRSAGGDRGLIEAVLPRGAVLHRQGEEEEIGAANIDAAAVISGISRDFNLRRIERFLTNIRSGGAEPALILTKADLVEDAEAYRRRARARFGDLPVYLVDSISGRGKEELDALFLPRRTVVLAGISGTGKSTLLNMLCGEGIAATGELRENDGRGRHTTTGRSLFRLPSGALVIDTPGVRSVGIAADGAGTEEAFEEIAALAAQCRFSDCSHRGEPGCRVREALLEGEIEQDRYLNFLRLREEAVSREEELRLRREKGKQLGKIIYQMRKENRRGGFHG